MLEARAVVVQVEGGQAIVESRQGGGCGHCRSSQGCGSGKLTQLFCTQPRRFHVRNGIDARVGEEVLLTVEDGALLRSALILYLLPLALLLSGGLIGTHWAIVSNHDASAAIGGIAGLAAGFLLARMLARQYSQFSSRPIIMRCSDVAYSPCLKS